MNKAIFPCILIVLDVGAAIVYLLHKDWARFYYWMLAGGLTATTLWMK